MGRQWLIVAILLFISQMYTENSGMVMHVPQAVLLLVFHHFENRVDRINDDK